jgi:LysR family transcriptional regulator, hypochlorite-specific transcription factor HypT
MRLDWLQDIQSVAETGSFSEAAQRRNVTQSAFSRRIRQIEDFLGIELFDRGKKPIQLRATTRENLDQIVSLIAATHQLASDLRRGDRVAGQRIAIASQHALLTSMTPQLVRQVHAQARDMQFRLVPANLDECLAMLVSRRVDFAITYAVAGEESPLSEEFVESMPVGSDRLIPVVASDQRHCVPDWLAAGVLPSVTYPDEVFFGAVMRRNVLPLLDDRLRLNVHAVSELTLAVLELCSQGLGVAWVPLSTARTRLGAGEIASVEHVLPSVSLRVHTSRLVGRHELAEAKFWQTVRAQYRNDDSAT